MTDSEIDFTFFEAFRKIQSQVYDIALQNGFYEKGSPRSHGSEEQLRFMAYCLAHLHSEVSEAFGALRKGNPPSRIVADQSELEEELADVVACIMSFAEHFQLDVASALLKKRSYNRTRPYRHGKRI